MSTQEVDPTIVINFLRERINQLMWELAIVAAQAEELRAQASEANGLRMRIRELELRLEQAQSAPREDTT